MRFSQIYIICESLSNCCFIELSDADDHKFDHEKIVFDSWERILCAFLHAG